MQKGKRIIIELKDIVKKYYLGKPNELEILHGIDLQVEKGEFVSIVGESGSGKSTLMNIIGALDKPDSGIYNLDGINICNTKEKKLSGIRNQKIGFVFQTYNLVARTSAIANVELPMLYNGIPKAERHRRAEELLELVGMKDRMLHKPEELSGGQKQRVAIARAMANCPSVLFADEPTAALDHENAFSVMKVLKEYSKKHLVLVITHDISILKDADQIIEMWDGMTGAVKGGEGN